LIYARSQNNNHLLVEAVALYTVGLLFPEFRSSPQWHKLGKQWLLEALNRQVLPDGGYVQHSTNYQRLAIQAGLWASRIAAVNDEPLPQGSIDALHRMSVCLGSLVNPETGKVPNFGPNDGAHILPITTCPFEDFRPVIQAAGRAFSGRRTYPPGPWDEGCVWLGLEVEGVTNGHRLGATSGVDVEIKSPLTPAHSPKGRGGIYLKPKDHFQHAGLYLMGGHQAWGMLRCARFASRPGHSDQLHFDLWWGGRNIVCDPGTYLYNGAPPWDNSLTGAHVHNTVVIDDQEPMTKAGRFLWLDWSCGELLGHWRSQDNELEVICAKHDGYRRLDVVHRRTVVRARDDIWVVIDDICGTGFHTARTGWLLPDSEWRIKGDELLLTPSRVRLTMRTLGAEGPVGLYRAGVLIEGEPVSGEETLWGWRSLTYATKEPALRMVRESVGNLPLRLETWWSLNDADHLSLDLERRDPCLGLSGVSKLEYKGSRLDIDDAHTVDS
ncbi:MAG: alginate lyase family protein, partial [Anaerolineaceae bacterium]